MGLFLIAIIISLGAILIVTTSPVAAILAVIGTFASVSGLLALNGLDALALFVLIIYIGAIAILFLFITFLLNLKKTPEGNVKIRNGLSTISTAVLVLVLALTKLERYEQSAITDLLEDAGSLGAYTALYESVTFWLIGLLLLVAMIGVILLTKKHKLKEITQTKVF